MDGKVSNRGWPFVVLAVAGAVTAVVWFAATAKGLL